MKIYTDNEGNIKAINNSIDNNLIEYEVDRVLIFEKMSDKEILNFNFQLINNGIILKKKSEVIQAENSWKKIRQQRNHLLRETDWTQLIDAPLTEEEIGQYKQYRQALRDLPQQYENPEDVIFPSI